MTDSPIAASVGSGGTNRASDVLRVQQLLNSAPVASGGVAALLAEDGICGPKTQAAINVFEAKVRGKSDGRVDPAGPTLKALTHLICGSTAVPAGHLGLSSKPNPLAGAPNLAVPPNSEGAAIVAVGCSALKMMEPKLHLLRTKMHFQSDDMHAFMNKHFCWNGEDVDDTDIRHVQGILERTQFYVSRATSFGNLPIENVVLYDPVNVLKAIGWTINGGDKLTPSQFQLYATKEHPKVLLKAPGYTVFLTSEFGDTPAYEKHWVMLHEMAHFTGDRYWSPERVADYGYAFEAKFGNLSKFQRLHNAESLSLFFLEFCIGTFRVYNLPRMAWYADRILTWPHVSLSGEFYNP